MRRSALDFLGGKPSMSLAQLSAILAATGKPLSADFAATRFIQLYLYAHRVDGLQPGVYRFWPECAELEQPPEAQKPSASRSSKTRCIAFSRS